MVFFFLLGHIKFSSLFSLSNFILMMSLNFRRPTKLMLYHGVAFHCDSDLLEPDSYCLIQTDSFYSTGDQEKLLVKFFPTSS